MARGKVSELPSLSYLHLVEISSLAINGTSLVAQTMMSLPATYETWVQSLRWEDPLDEEGMAIYCLENPHGQRSLVDYSPWGCKESEKTEQ